MRARVSFSRTHRQLFRKIDKNNNGLISKDELKIYIQSCGLPGQIEHLAATIFQQCDENKDGYIDFSQFRHIITMVQKKNERPPSHQELLFAFQLFDTDGNHLICHRQFWKRVKALDPSMSRKEADLIFNEIDQDKDGCIDFGEFVRYLDFPSGE